MKRLVLVTAVLLMAAVAQAAQNNLAWDMPGETAVSAQGNTYRVYVDGSTTGQVLTGVTCAGTTTVTCQTPFPFTVNGVTVTSGADHQYIISSQPPNGPEVLSVSTAFHISGQPGNLRAK